MKATQVLRDEHEGILAMLAVIQAAIDRLQAGKSIPPALMTDAVDFITNFADRCHHGKEEKQLFPAMIEHGVPNEGGPVGVMLAEHTQGRAYVRALSAAAQKYATGDLSAVPALIENALGYITLLRQHIEKENGILFPMADHLLTDAEQDALFDAFAQIEANEMGPGVHERYHAMIGAYQKQVAEWNKMPV